MIGEASPESSPATLPPWYPPWAKEMAELYFSGTTSLFILHGNVHDLVRCESGAAAKYQSLSEFLASQVFGSWDIVLHHDLGRGLRPLAGTDARRLQPMVQYLSARLGEPSGWPRDPDKLLLLIERLIERALLEDSPGRPKSIGLVFEYAQYLVPAGDIGSLARGQGTNLVRFLGWAQNPYIKRVNIAFCLIAESLSEVNDRLVQNPYVAAIEIPLPERSQRQQFIQWFGQGQDFSALSKYSPHELADLSAGLTLVNLNGLLSQARRSGHRVDGDRFRQLKKTMIERECRGLLEFVEPPYTLDLVVGHEAAVQRLREDARWISQGQFDAAPMGYLICGPVGTGKTFLAECYAGSIGIPCVKLRNFRSKYVGETEGNLEHVLTVLRSLGPVVVIVDEADAALGTRQAEGDSGTSARVFGMIASQMGDTRYRGKIVWMLLTSRPDLLPIDLKRQGRAEVHIPLFYPETAEEIAQMFQVLARKNKAVLEREELAEVDPNRHLSGADIESIILLAKRRAMARAAEDQAGSSGSSSPGSTATARAARAQAARVAIQRADLEQALEEFIPSAQGLEKQMQELAAALECTQLSFLPQAWRDKMSEPDGRARLQERLAAVRQLLDE